MADHTSTQPRRHVLYARMTGRSTEDAHRAATPLELFFDLCFVVAIALGAGSLHHDLAEGMLAEGAVRYAIVFFGIWWAWVNFTWFASAFDTDDVPYRLATFVQIAGALILAAGVPRAFEEQDFNMTVLGYVVMRLALVSQWLRVAYSDPDHRPAALRFAIGVAGMQVAWVLLLLAPDAIWRAGFLVGVVGELLVPVWAERAARTPWHAGHIAERYGLFTLIVLGECVLAATTAFQTAFDSDGRDFELIVLALSSLVVVCSMWWLYFDGNIGAVLVSERAFLWGYGHYFVFAAAAAIGAGIAVNVDYVTDHAELSQLAAGYAVAIPAAVFLISTWVLHGISRDEGPVWLLAPGIPALLLLTPITGLALPLVALVLALLVAVKIATRDYGRVGARKVLLEE